jgi:hypothetical protein
LLCALYHIRVTNVSIVGVMLEQTVEVIDRQ